MRTTFCQPAFPLHTHIRGGREAARPVSFQPALYLLSCSPSSPHLDPLPRLLAFSFPPPVPSPHLHPLPRLFLAFSENIRRADGICTQVQQASVTKIAPDVRRQGEGVQ